MKNVIYTPFIYDSDTESENDFSITTPRGYKSRYTKYEDDEDIIEDIIDPEIEEPSEIDFSLPDINYRFPDKESFKTRMLQEYSSALQARGIDPSYAKVLVAQDALESGWGSKPSGLYNYGNITGKSGKTIDTPEFINGQWETRTQTFADYNSIRDFVNAKIDLLSNYRYNVFNHPISEFATRVSTGGYATAPNYAYELNRIIRSMRRGGILKFDKGGKTEANEYLDNNRTHYNKKIGEYSFLPPFNLPYHITKNNIDRINIVNGLPKEKLGSDVIAAYENNSRTIYDTSNDSHVIRHEIGHALFNELEKNVESLIKKYDGHIYLDGISQDEYYDSPREIIARVWTHLKDVGYKGDMSTRDTLRFIQDARDRLTTVYRTDIRRADGSRTRSTHDENGIKVHDSISRGDIDFDNSKVYRTYNDRNHIIDRYKDSFILDLYQLIYEMKDNVQYAKFGTKIRKFDGGGDLYQQVFDWASDQNGKMRYEMTRGNKRFPTFYQLLRDPNRPVLDLGDGTTGTHKLSYVQDGDKWYIYPEIQWHRDSSGNWVGIDYSQEDDWKIGWENAYKNGDYLQIPNEAMAKYFTENYKTAYSQWYPGFGNVGVDTSEIDTPTLDFRQPTWDDLVKFTTSFENFKPNVYLLKTEKGSWQELIGHGISISDVERLNPELAKKWREHGVTAQESLQWVKDFQAQLNANFEKYIKNYSSLPMNIKVAIIDAAYNGNADNFWNSSPKLKYHVENNSTPLEIASELDHSMNSDSWLGVRSADRRAMVLNEYDWDYKYVDKYGRHLDPNKTVGPRDWESAQNYRKYMDLKSK